MNESLRRGNDRPRRQPGPGQAMLLLAGIVLGIFAGPACLGRLAPDRYQQWFPDDVSVQAKLLAIEADHHKLAATGVTDVALQEYDQRRAGEKAELSRQRDQARANRGRATALLLALAAIMFMESMLGRPHRLTTVRYAVMAVLLALLLASPGTWTQAPLTLTAAIVAFAGAAWFMSSQRT
ncbi:MAG: hypothetical protein IT440_06360 [Phycisphaeraceae bacterium]|nr:hypothetical protein [Phycisphaeraceae bacterium]